MAAETAAVVAAGEIVAAVGVADRPTAPAAFVVVVAAAVGVVDRPTAPAALAVAGWARPLAVVPTKFAWSRGQCIPGARWDQCVAPHLVAAAACR